MNATKTDPLRREIEQQSRRVQGLQTTVYVQVDPSVNPDLFGQLVEEEAKLQQLRDRLKADSADGPEQKQSDQSTTSRGRFLGADTTGLCVKPTLLMDPLPTGAYHLMDHETDPLLSVLVENTSTDIRRVCIKAFIEGLSAQAVRTVEVKPRQQVTLNLQPTLFPERAKAITEIQRATLHVIAEDLDGKIESHDTYAITCLARTASFNAVQRPETGELLDLSHYYGAWVTPHTESVQERIRRSVELMPDRRMLGYQGDPDIVPQQVAALYESLREADIVYVNSVIDYGAPPGLVTQRTRLPRESIAARSANCIDGTVLMASLLEGVSLNPAIVLVPGHAFVGWEVWDGADEWRFLETTMIAAGDFEAASQSAQRQYEQFQKFASDKVKLHSLKDLRNRSIWPME